MKLIPRIREKRMEQHLTQKQLAEKTGLDTTQLSRFENGHNKPNAETLWLIARGIGCLVDELYEVSN